MLEFGGGLTGRINANISVFANVDYEFAVGAAEDEKRNGVRGEYQFGSPAHLRSGEGADGGDKPRRDSRLGVPWACMPRLGEWAAD